MFLKVGLWSLRIRFDGGRIIVGIPVGRANFAVFLNELEGLQQSQRFVDGTANGQVIDGLLTHNTLWIDDEQATECDAGIFDQHIVVASNLFGQIGE